MRHMYSAGVLSLCCCVSSAAQTNFSHDDAAQLWLPDLVSTAQSEVRITFSPDGALMLWGAIDWADGAGGWDIYLSQRTAGQWSKPVAATFNSPANDFDPSFAPDGSAVYFFSNRPGGFGGDDIYFAAFDSASGTFRAAVNVGGSVNTTADEWAPVVCADARRLMFASDGHGGSGKHDLFIAHRRGREWTAVTNLVELNSPQADFDAAFLQDERSIVYSRGDFEGTVALYLAEFRHGKLQPGVRLPGAINSTEPGAWTYGPSTSPHDPQALYFTSRHAQHRGRADIYRIGLRLTVSAPHD